MVKHHKSSINGPKKCPTSTWVSPRVPTHGHLAPGRYFLELKEHTVPVGSTALTHPWAFLVRISGTTGMKVSKPPILGVSIAPIKMLMTGGWCRWFFLTHIIIIIPIYGEWIVGDWSILCSLARQFLYSTYFRGKKWVEADVRTRHFLRLLWNKIHPSSLLGQTNPFNFAESLRVFHGFRLSYGFHAVFMVFSMNFSMVFSYLVGHGL